MLGNQHYKYGENTGWIKEHSLGIVLTVMMFVQTALAIWSGARVWGKEDPFQLSDPALNNEFWTWWVWEYNISLVADTFGVLLIVMLSKWFYEKDSAESTK